MRHSGFAGESATSAVRAWVAARLKSVKFRSWAATVVLAVAGVGAGAVSGPVWAENDKIYGEWCRDDRSFKVERENVITYHGSRVTGQYDEQGLGVRYIAPSNEPEAGTEIAIALRSTEMAYLFRKPKGATGYSDREAWRRCKVTS